MRAKRNRAALAAVIGLASLAAGSAAPRMAAASPAPARARAVWVKDCPTSKFGMHPKSFVVACADGGLYFQDLRWTGWGASRAVGRGILWANLCKPSCVAVKLVSEPGTLTLSRVAERAGRETYGYAYVRPLPPDKYHLRKFGYELAYR